VLLADYAVEDLSLSSPSEGLAEPSASADGAGISAFRGMPSFPPAPLLSCGVRRRDRGGEP
jgi:hypothetical protein